MPSNAAMELKVLINILSQGTALPTLLNQTKQLTTALTNLQTQAAKTPSSPAVPPPPKAKDIDEATKALQNMEGVVNKLYKGLQFLAGGFLALQSVRFLKDLADTAARAEVLSTVLHVVGNNAGYTTAQLDKADRQIQSLGITAAASRQSLTQFLQAELDLADAPKLARAAQDAAVILGTNSSEAFERLVTSVQTSNTMMLRHMGIIVSADSAYQRYAVSIGKTVGQLTSSQRAQAFLNATLEQTKRIQGSYVAAMGDVGKQLTSLDRLTTDLKTSLGNNLLPAYLAIVEELTLFLQNMELVADSVYGQGQGARKLGEDVKFLASKLREAVEFVVKYRTEIATVVGVWLTISKIAVPLAGQLYSLKDAFTGLAEGGALARLVAGLGLVGGAIIGFELIILGLTIYSERFRAFIGSVIGVLWSLVEVMGAVQEAFGTGVLATIKELYNVIAHPASPETWIKPWQEWSDAVAKKIQRIKDLWDDTRYRFGQAIGEIPLDPYAGMKADDDRQKRLEKEAELNADILEKSRQIIALKKSADSGSEITQAEAELSKMKEDRDKLTVQRKAEISEGKIGPGELARQENTIFGHQAQKEADNLTKKLEDAQKTSKFMYEGGTERSRAFLTQIGEFSNLLEVYSSEGGKARVSTEALFRSLQESGAAVKVKGDLEELNIAIANLRKKGVDAVTSARLTTLQGDAAKQVRDELLRETARRDRETEEGFRRTEQYKANKLSHELEMLKTTNSIFEDLDEQSYSRRGMDLEEYYDRRLARLSAQRAKESEIARNDLRSLLDEKEQGIPRTDKDRADLDLKISKARQALEALDSETQAQAMAIGTQRDNAREDSANKTKQTLMDIRALHGDEVEAMAAVNNKYDEQYNKAHTNDERAVITAERQQEINKIALEYRQRDLELSLLIVQSRREELDIHQAILDADKTRLKTREDTGQITQAGAMRERNALLQRQIEIDRYKVLEQTVELEQKRLFYDTRRQEIIAQMAILYNKTADSPETQAELNRELGATNTQIQNLETNIISANAAIEAAQAHTELYGKQVGQVFTDSLANALTKSVTDVKNAAEAWKGIFDSVTKEIAGIIAKNIAQGIVRAMGIERGINALFSRLPGFGGMGGSGFEIQGPGYAEGGVISGPGTGTSDSIPAMVSAGEHIMPAEQTRSWLPVLEGIRTGRLRAFATGGVVQSIAVSSLIPRHYAAGGVVVGDGGAASVQPGGAAGGNMTIMMHPDTLNMTLRDWLEHEVVRQYGRR